MPLKDRGKKLREFININHKLVNSHTVFLEVYLMKKSASAEDYMKSILILHRRNGSVRSSEVAEEMGVSRPSVCNAMKKLRKQEMIYFGENDCICFTETGKIFAEKVYSKHSLIAKFLRRIGVSKKTADEEACEIEHAISDETYECLNRYYEKKMLPG